MNINIISLRFVVASLLCVLLQVSWGDEYEEPDLVVQEYNQLFDLANEGDASDKVNLFLYVAKHAGELEQHAQAALTLLAEASDNGYGEASFWIGYSLENGIWMDKDDQGAMIFYVLSAQQGYDRGMYSCVAYFGQAAIAASSSADRESALNNAQKWYNALSEIREESPDLFGSARFDYAITRLKISPSDVYGMTLLGEAAIDGNAVAADMIREWHAIGLSTNFDGDEDAARLFEVWDSTIQVIGPGRVNAP